MKASAVVANILKKEGVKVLFAYPENEIIEEAARIGIRPVIVRQERTGIHMADAMSRITSAEQLGVFAMQLGPGAENGFGGVAQAFADSSPILVLPGGYHRRDASYPVHFDVSLNYRHITKWVEQVNQAQYVSEAMRRAFSKVRNGRPGPVAVEFPLDLLPDEAEEPSTYTPSLTMKSAPDPADVSAAVDALVAAKRPVLYAGQGVHYAKAWAELIEMANVLGAPVTTSLEGKSAFPEDNPLYLGSGGRAQATPVYDYIENADTIFGIGCSFARTLFGIQIPEDKTIIHATNDPMDVGQSLYTSHGLIGDAKLTLQALNAELKERLGDSRAERRMEVASAVSTQREKWLNRWMPKLTSDSAPMTPYRIIWDLLNTVDPAETIITHDAGSPRDQLSPFWRTPSPLGYIGWGKSTQLGYGLGLIMGAKIARPEKLCINVMGDAAIGFTGMDFETAVREQIPILTIIFNNFAMAMEEPFMQNAMEKFNSTDISGNYADMARAFGGHGERVEVPSEIVPAIKRAVEQTRNGTPALLEFITCKELDFSVHWTTF